MATPDERLVLRVPNLQLKNRGVWYTSFVPSLCMYDYTYEFEGEDETSIRIPYFSIGGARVMCRNP